MRLNLQLQTVSSCNATCVFCPYVTSWHRHHPGLMSDATFARVLEELRPRAFKLVCPYLMNEPLNDPRLVERIEALVTTLDYEELQLATNGSRLDGPRADALIACLERRPHDLWISFHGTNAQNYQEIMGLDFATSLSRVCDFLVKADGRLKVTLRGAGSPRIRADALPTWFSKEEYHAFWQGHFARLGLQRWPTIDYFSYHDRADNLQGLSFGFRRASLEGFSCVRTSEWLHIDYTGQLVLCCADYHREQLLGDLSRHPLDELLVGPQRRAVVDQLEGRVPSPPDFICKRCHWGTAE